MAQKIDGRDRVVETLQYDLLGRLVSRSSMDGGVEWSFIDCMGKPMWKWNNGEWSTRTVYDELGREQEVWLSENGQAEILAKKVIYGEQEPDNVSRNLRGRICHIFDQAGLYSNSAFDFKGNPIRTQTQLAIAYKSLIDWNAAASLEEEKFESSAQFDALNRAIETTDAGGAITKRVYNLLGQLDSVLWRPSNQAGWEPFVSNISYAADGQPLSMSYGNETGLKMEYDELSRATKRRTLVRGKDTLLADIAYTYDPTGRLSHSMDNAQQLIFFNNHGVQASYDYTYDAIGQLVAAQGRQQIDGGNGSARSLPSYSAKSAFAKPGLLGNGQQLCKYLETYEYDDAGNILLMKHQAADDTSISGWTRQYFYDEPSTIDPSEPSNRLSRTEVGKHRETYWYDDEAGAPGCVTSMAGHRSLTWDFADRLRSCSKQILNDGTPETTWYVYDSAGNRVRKVVERSASGDVSPTKLKDTLYIGPLTTYRKYKGDGVTIKREKTSAQVLGSSRIAVVETIKGSSAQSLKRYQPIQDFELDDHGQIITYEEFSPFGVTTYSMRQSETEASRKLRFAGYESDKESGMYYCGARYYAP